MNFKIAIIALVLLFISCTKQENVIQGNWMPKYYIDPDGRLYEPLSKELFNFSNDSITIKNFLFEYDYFGQKLKQSRFEIKSNKILTNLSEEYREIKICHLSKDSLVLDIDDFYKIVFGRLLDFNGIDFSRNLTDSLTTNVYDYDDTGIEIEFLKDNYFIIDTLLDFSTIEGWNLDTFKNEIFLVFAGSIGPMLHFNKFNWDTIFFKFYGENVEDYVLTKNEIKQIYTKSQLKGRWREKEKITDGDTINHEKIKKDFGFNYPEFTSIEFLDTIINEKFGDEIKRQRNWSLSKSGEVIIFNEAWPTERKYQWNIKKLNSDELIVLKKYGGFYPKITEVVYDKLK